MLMYPIKVEGLADLNRSLKKVSADLPKALRLAHNEAANVVVKYAMPLTPARTGRARSTIKAKSTRTESRVQGGSAKAAYYPWLDFGGRVGRKHSVRRPFIPTGRIIYPAYAKHQKEVYDVLVKALKKLCRDAGLEVS